MEFEFQTGVRNLHAEANMDFQLNRLICLGGARPDEVATAASRIRTLADWKREFMRLGEKAIAAARPLEAAAYFRGAEFFMNPDDPDKERTYDRAQWLFREGARADFDSGAIVETKVPCGRGYLPAWRLPAPGGRPLETLVLHGGFDSCKEELYPAVDFVRKQGYEIILFEGPGQGEALMRYHVPMTPEWERPVKLVLDHFNLNEVTLVGLSLGGYLAPRAAAFEPRIKRVVAWDVIWDFYEVLTAARGTAMAMGIRTLMALKAKKTLNTLARAKMNRDSFTQWGISRAMMVFGADSPYEALERARGYTMKGISGKVTQDVLLLAGTKDHFIGLPMFFKQARAFTNARSFTGRIFTEKENGHTHCQVGNLPLVLKVIAMWIAERTGGALPSEIPAEPRERIA